MDIQAFFDTRTSTLTYVVHDAASGDAVVIDPVLDYNVVGSKVWTESVDRVAAFLREEGLTLHYILETHAHADHLSGARMLKDMFPGAQVAIGERITRVQEVFKRELNLPDAFPTDGRQFDRLLRDGETVQAGSLAFSVIFTPGHTPACATYRFGDALFTGDVLFMPDSGTGRCDFPAGSAKDMYHSITERLYTLPEETRVFVGHDYQPGGRELAYQTTIGEQKHHNVNLRAGMSEEEFVKFRSERDRELDAPKLLYQSIQVNIDAGSLPDPEANGKRFLKIPINIFRPEMQADRLQLDRAGNG